MDGNAVLLALCLNLCLSFGHHHGLTLIEQAENWGAARLYCRAYFVDLAAAHTESQLVPLIEVAKAVSGSIWIGLHYSDPSGWSWVDRQVLSYNPWKKENKLGRCGTIDTRLSGDKKLLQRICKEPRPFICQGPVPPKRVEVDFVGTDCIFLKWDRPISMETVQYSFNISYSSVFQGSSACKLSNSTSTSICGLSPGSEYAFSVSTVMRTADQSPPTSVNVVTRLNPPSKVWVDTIQSDSVSLSWTAAFPMSSTTTMNISYSSYDGSQSGFKVSPMNCSRLVITDLQSQTSYIFNLTVVSHSGPHSIPLTVYLHTCCPEITKLSALLWSFEFMTPVLAFWLLYYFIKKINSKKNPKEVTDSNEAIRDLISEKLEV